MKFSNVVIMLVSSALVLYSQSSFGVPSSYLEQQKNRKASPRIINGVDAKKGAYPFIVGLISSSTTEIGEGSIYCGASFIGSHYVLTASHCVEGSLASDIDVVVGEHDVTDPTSGVRYKVAQVYMHENYDAITFGNDIAILELETAVTNVSPIKPLTPEIEASLNVGDLLTVMGWGNLSVTDDPSYPTILQEVDLPLYDQEKCNTAYDGEITDVMLCAGFEEGGKDSCQGDSGGPLIIKKNNEWYQAGVVSFGDGCAVAAVPGVYARVSKFVDWIKQKKAGVSYQQKEDIGYVESTYEDTVTYTFKNLSATEYGITNIEFTELDKVAQPTVESNSCNSAAIQQNESCEFTVKVTSTALGEAGFGMEVHTNHPENNLAIQSFSMNALEKSNLDMKTLVNMNDNNIEWYSGGDALWEAQTTNTLQGDNAIASGDILGLQSSVLLAVIKNPETTSFSFNYLVQAEEGYDGLSIMMNGQYTDFFATGITQTEYKEETITLKEGIDRIAFIFFKNEEDGSPVGFDKAYIDLVQNNAPVAKLAQLIYTVKATQEVLLDASKSEDSDGSNISYQWELLGETLGATLTNSTSVKATFIAGDKEGDVSIKVTITDPGGASSSAVGSVTIAPADKKKSGGAGGFLLIFSLFLLSLSRRK
jgi:secreted trypsin-like serine protease